MAFPTKARFVVIGAGIHGLSTAWHLAKKLKKKNGNSSNNDIVVVDKGGICLLFELIFVDLTITFSRSIF